MNRIVRRGFIVFVGIVAIVYWFLTQVGVALAISPAIEWLTGLFSIFSPLVSVLSDPFVLTAVLLLLGGAAVVVWYRIDDLGIKTVEWLAWCKEWLGFGSPVVVRGSLDHGDVRWIGHHTRDGRTKVEHRACPHCAVKLVPRRIEHTKVNQPNTPITADKETREREAQARENVFGRQKADSEELVSALVCPRDTCGFSIEGEEHIEHGKSAVKKQFRTHFNREMRAGGSDPFGKWHQRAKERLDSGLEPTPADLWDAYVPQSDDDAVMVNQAFGHGLPGEDESVTCDVLEKHKLDADSVDQLIELFPDGFDSILAWLVRSGYLEKRREITRKMNAEGEKCRRELTEIEQQYGSTIERVLVARHDRAEPRSDLETIEYQLETANTEVRELREDLERDYLPTEKRRWLSTSKNSVADAAEYIREVRAFVDYREKIEPAIGAFEERFEPYNEGENYMITPHEEFLKPMCLGILHQLADLHREVRLELLPPEKTEWAREMNDSFTGRSELLESYNEMFEERECERYADLFKTEHGPLNNEQQKAIVRNDLHNLVDASAGTGKTLTLTYRFLYLYRRGVPLDDIVAVTFTNEAADEMRERIAKTLNGVKAQQLNVSTYHSFANDIVADSISGPINTDLDDAHEHYVEAFLKGDIGYKNIQQETIERFEEDHEAFLRAANKDSYINKHKGDSQSREAFLCEQYTEFIDTARRFQQTPEDIHERLTPVKHLQNHFGKAASTILGAFLDHAEETDEPVDYNDMVESATQLGEAAPDHFSQEYQHILFDEFQDVDSSVLDFVEIFLGESGDTRLFAVGDDWQSIYGFKGSDPRYFIEFDERFEGTKRTQLTINYRCPPTIVEAGDDLMSNSEDDQNEKDVEAFSDSSIDPVAHKLSGISENRTAWYVANLVEDKLTMDDTKPKDVMVLSHNDEASPFMNRLRSHLDKREIPRIPVNDDDGDPDGVQTQSIYSSKGTEAKHVILANAIDDKYDCVPQERKENELITPAIANPATHYAEERRLFYVAMTRTEHQLDVITHLGCESRYLKEIYPFFEEVYSAVWTAEGILGPWDYPSMDNGQPITAQFACNGYTVELKTWEEKITQKLEAGRRYRLSNIEPENDGWGAQIELDESVDIEEIESQ
jgi:superfamily I DNA/RNA helicase